MTNGALSGIRVIDASTLFAGPIAAMHLGDLGAEVIKVEHPSIPDPARGHGPSINGQAVWWKSLGRNKRTMTINLSKPEGQELFKKLAETADVVIENFRPGTLERWGLGLDVLSKGNAGLILARITGFGQNGPYSRRPGFGTIAEAMSGFATLTGDPDGPPTLPPFGLADGVAALTTSNGILAALHARSSTGRGQVVDVALIEPLLSLLGPQLTAYDMLGTVQKRFGNRSGNNAPRNLYKTADEHWVAVSTSSQSIAERVMHLVCRPDLIAEDWFSTALGRFEHVDLLDGVVGGWISKHMLADVMEAFVRAEAAIGPVYDAKAILEDPQYQALGTAVRVPDPDYGTVLMQSPPLRLSETMPTIRWTGRAHGEDTNTVLAELGYDAVAADRLREAGAI